MLDLFLTCGPQSDGAVRGLIDDLRALGDAVWCEEQQGTGLAWWDQTLARIRSCDALLFALTPRTLESEACWREMRYAHALGKPVLAIELSERTNLGATPAPLDTLPFVNYRKRDRESALRLCRALRPLGKAAPLPHVLPAPPGLPPSYLAGLRELIGSRGKLDVSQQNRLVAELAGGSRELHSSFESRQLLLELRQRRDLSASAAGEIDALLRKTAATQFKLRPPMAPPPSPGARALPRHPEATPARGAAPTGQRRALQGPRWLTPKRVAASLGVLASCTAAGCLLVTSAAPDHDAGTLQLEATDTLQLGSLQLGSLQLGSLEVPGVELAALLVMLSAGLAAAWQVAARWTRSG